MEELVNGVGCRRAIDGRRRRRAARRGCRPSCPDGDPNPDRRERAAVRRPEEARQQETVRPREDVRPLAEAPPRACPTKRQGRARDARCGRQAHFRAREPRPGSRRPTRLRAARRSPDRHDTGAPRFASVSCQAPLLAPCRDRQAPMRRRAAGRCRSPDHRGSAGWRGHQIAPQDLKKTKSLAGCRLRAGATSRGSAVGTPAMSSRTHAADVPDRAEPRTPILASRPIRFHADCPCDGRPRGRPGCDRSARSGRRLSDVCH